jgi:hypothetical protein
MIALPTFRGALSGFSPLALQPALWLSDTGSDPGVWPDLSGNGRNATQGTSANQPNIAPAALNGRQVRQFNGVNRFLQCNAVVPFFATNDGALSIFVVSKSNTSGGFGRVISARFASGIETHFFRHGSAFRYVRDDGVSPKLADGKTADTAWNIHSITSSGIAATVGTNGTIYANNTDINVNTLTSINSCQIGADGTGGNLLDGSIAELIVLPYAAALTQRQQIERYLSAKWGISIA